MLPQLQTERQLRAIEAADAPHMSANGRRELFATYSRRLSVDRHEAATPTVRDLSRIGIAVETVGADGMPVDAGMQRDSTEGET